MVLFFFPNIVTESFLLRLVMSPHRVRKVTFERLIAGRAEGSTLKIKKQKQQQQKTPTILFLLHHLPLLFSISLALSSLSLSAIHRAKESWQVLKAWTEAPSQKKPSTVLLSTTPGVVTHP